MLKISMKPSDNSTLPSRGRVKSATDFGPDTVAASFHAANTASLWQMGLHSVDDWAVPDADQELLLPPTFAAEDMSLNLNIWTPVNTHMVQVSVCPAIARKIDAPCFATANA
eukprot:SAG31_NODE_1761_length_7326_cov_2.101148_9_plen_112_part_00